MPKINEKIGGQSNHLPAQEKLHKIVGKDQQKHGKGEKVKKGEEFDNMWILRHITKGIGKDKKGDKGYQKGIGGRERIPEEAKREV